MVDQNLTCNKFQEFVETYCLPSESGCIYFKPEYVLLYEGNRIVYLYDGKMYVEAIHDDYDEYRIWDNEDILDKIDIFKLVRGAKQ